MPSAEPTDVPASSTAASARSGESSTSFDVVTFGEPMVLLLAADDLPLPVAQRFEVGVAGAESNLATGLARLGHRVAYFGRVGDDTFGDQIRRTLRSEGIDVSRLLADPQRPTGLLIRDSPQDRPITVEYRRAGSAATALTPEQLPSELLTDTRILHATGITAALSESALEATEQAMMTAAAAGVTVSFDPNIRLRLADPERWQVIIKRLAPHAKIVFTGREEAEIVSPGVEPERWYADHGAETVVVKDGGAGSFEHVTGGDLAVPAGIRTVPLVDPIGAGDGFNAGWLSAWLDGTDGLTEEDARIRLTTGAAVASMVVATRGDATGLPNRAILAQVLAGSSDVIR
jgi:2-dehydro-3-deoxygluconokinase